MFAHLALAKRLPQLKRVVNPIFIVGVGRSGTTLLGTLLSLHREVGYLNEPNAIWHSTFTEDDVSGHYGRGPARYRLFAEDAAGR